MPNITPYLRGYVEDGQFRVSQEDETAYHALLSKMNNSVVLFTIKKETAQRTSAENRYYWGVIVKIVADEMGTTPDEAHELLKSLFLKVGGEIKGKDGRVYRYEAIRSSAYLPIDEFEKYCEDCRNWAMVELNCRVPLPNEIEINI